MELVPDGAVTHYLLIILSTEAIKALLSCGTRKTYPNKQRGGVIHRCSGIGINSLTHSQSLHFGTTSSASFAVSQRPIPRQFRQAFAFLEKQPVVSKDLKYQALPEEDFEFIKELEAELLRRGIATLPKE